MRFIQAESPLQLQQMKALYELAFPSCERKPFSLICEKQKQGTVDILYLEQDDAFCGLAITMKDQDLVLLDYFAIAENRRSAGLGSTALCGLFDYYAGYRFFLEIESTKEESVNKPQRLRRKQFYLKNHMTELGIEANVFGTNMELLVYGAPVTRQEYYAVYENIYGPEKAKHIQISTFLM